MNHKILVATLLTLFLVGAGLSQGQTSLHSLQINLTLNTTLGKVFIPGVGEQNANSLPSATYTSPPHFYLASYLNSNLKGLVFSQEKPLSISVRGNSTHHFLSLNQNLTRSQVFLVFTKGDYTAIDNRMSLIEGGTFLSQASPSFSFGLGSKHTITLLLNYSDIDIQGNFTFKKGVHEITLQSNKTGSKKILLINETI